MRKIPFIVLFLYGLFPFRAGACSIPVFQYAREYWAPSLYQIQLIHKGPLTREERDIITEMEKLADPSPEGMNFYLKMTDLSERKPGREIGNDILSGERSRLFIRYPGEGTAPAWSGPLERDSVSKILDSPVRRKIRDNLLTNDTAVWLFVESGRPEIDDRVKRLLEEELEKLEQTLDLPDQSDTPNYSEEEAGQYSDLGVSFSTVTLNPGDPGEEFLVSSLINSEADLEQYEGEPMVFPIYGKGIALYALVGKGITRENIREAAVFLTGPCSCIVKDSNPGTDLLMKSDWEGLTGGLEPPSIDTESLSGLGVAMSSLEEQNPDPTIADPDERAQNRGGGILKRNVFLSIGVVFVLLFSMTVWAVWKIKRSS